MEESNQDKIGNLRPLNPQKDLYQVADLIELCFKGSIDKDGKDYIRYLRSLARNANTILPGSAGQSKYAAIQGFVYEIERRIIGNLSMLPFHKDEQFIYLIANVAVHPSFRRQGIADQMTRQALRHARTKGAKSAWLQVRDDNPAAFNLYAKMGFREKTRRSTWTLVPEANSQYVFQSEIKVYPRKAADWQDQKKLMLKTYDDNVRWNLGLKPDRFKPGFLAWLGHFLNERIVHQYSAYHQDQWAGTLTLEKTNLYSDNLWVAALPEWEDAVLRSVLPYMRKKVPYKRPMNVNYPNGRAAHAFEHLGFEKNHTLIWMEASTSIPIHIKV